MRAMCKAKALYTVAPFPNSTFVLLISTLCLLEFEMPFINVISGFSISVSLYKFLHLLNLLIIFYSVAFPL